MPDDITGAASHSIARSSAHSRRFRLFDAMILVAAAAMACGASTWVGRLSHGRVSWSKALEKLRDYSRPVPLISNPITLMLEEGIIFVHLGVPLVAMWTLAWIPIRLRGPRPPLLGLARQPGFIATCAAAVAIGFSVPLAIRLAHVDEPLMIALSPVAPFGGLAVFVSWIAQLGGRKWRAEPSWIDRIGRALGVSWMLGGTLMTALLILALKNFD